MLESGNTVETVCLLSKLNTKQHIEVEVKMDELDLTSAESKATYQEIKDYVLEHSGMKVSSLYIAQVKQKCGIIERENYNKPKSEDAKQPQCPPDKEKAIKEALRNDLRRTNMERLDFCEFNMDTACVELKFTDGSMIAIDTIAVENEVADNMYQRSELDYLIYNDPVAYADLILNGDPETYLKTVTEYKPLDS